MIKLVRVDHRLLHGQVAFAWTKNLSVDCILIGPQIRYELNNVKAAAGNIPVDTINMQDYGLMNGKKVLETALKMIGE